jgi:hypothetical protein
MLWVGDPLIRCRQVLLATDVGDNSEFTSTPHGMNVDTHPKPATETDRLSWAHDRRTRNPRAARTSLQAIRLIA